MSNKKESKSVENEAQPTDKLSTEEMDQIAGGGAGLSAPHLPPTSDITVNKAKTADKAYTQMDGYIKQ